MDDTLIESWKVSVKRLRQLWTDWNVHTYRRQWHEQLLISLCKVHGKHFFRVIKDEHFYVACGEIFVAECDGIDVLLEIELFWKGRDVVLSVLLNRVWALIAVNRSQYVERKLSIASTLFPDLIYISWEILADIFKSVSFSLYGEKSRTCRQCIQKGK